MVYFLLFNLLLTSSFALKGYIPRGIDWGYGRVLVSDLNNNSMPELLFTPPPTWDNIVFYEYQPDSTFKLIDSLIGSDDRLLWDVGDFDLDGLSDIVIQSSFGVPIGGISIAESPDSFSYPTQEVWRDTVDIGTVQPICAYDIDKDGISEIIQTGGEPGTNYYIDFSIYESISDNLYQVKYFFESPETPTSTIAFGDFDRDSLNEFVMGTIDGQYSIFESPENDSFLPLFVNVQLPTKNIKDCFSVSDADGDGKMEFIVKGFTFPDGKFRVFIFEAIGDNTYEIIDTLIFSGFSNSYYGGYSDVGDVDGDGLPEIALEGSFRVYMIEADSNDNFYVFDTLPGNGSGSSIAVYDIDGNGLDEVIISGNNETRIYEWSGGAISENPGFRNPGAEFLFYPNIFKGDVKIDFALPFDQKTDVSLYDATGRLLRKMKVSKRVTITENNLSSGIYFLRIENPLTGKATCWKFLKIK